MGRVIHLENPGRERTSLIKLLKIATYNYPKEDQALDQKKDLAAFIALTLLAVSKTVDQSVQAWENRGYWLKADRFRLEWMWAESLEKALQEALIAGQWSVIDQTVIKISQKLAGVDLPKRIPKTDPWVGAYDKFQSLTRPK